MKSIKQLKNLSGKKVLVRCDFNVPIKSGKVKDDFKIQKTLPTISYLLKKRAKVILTSHLGRPKGKVDKKYSLRPVKNYLQKALKHKIKLVDLDKLDTVAKELNKTKFGHLVILENTRFSADEKKNSGKFAKNLSKLADIFVLDCFGVSHRAHASVVGPADYLPSYGGLLMEEEVKGLSKVLIKPKKPLVVVLGGAKMETKIPVLKNMIKLADHILVGGGISNTYFWAKGYKVGKSLVDKKFKKEVLLYGNKKKVIMPVDVVIGTHEGKQVEVTPVDKNFKVKRTIGIYGIGPETIKLYANYIKKAKILVWNGATGYFEQHPYEYGTYSMARLVASRAKGKAFGICGGGETVQVLKKLKLISDVDLVSTGGGSMLEFLSGKKLPGVKIIT